MSAQAGLAHARQCATQPSREPTPAWRSLTALGATGLLVPAAQDGLELGMFDAALTAQVLGRHVATTPFLAHTLATLAIGSSDDGNAARKLLSRLARGDTAVGVALSEAATAPRDGAGVRREGDLLHGSALFVMGQPADGHVLLADQHRQMHLVPARTPGLQSRPMPSVDATTPLVELRLEGVPVQPLFSTEPADHLARVIAAGRVLLAADALGAAEHLQAQALAYVQQRRQFGRAIGSFQAIKHLFADMAAALEPARSLLWHAAHAQDHDPGQRSLLAALAKAHIADATQAIARTCIEMHGAMGITDELGLHFWFQRIAQGRQLLGGPAALRQEAARLQGLC